jgi:sulfate permease, SulP family
MKIPDMRKEFSPPALLPSLTSGLIAAIITISIEVSLAALIFSGDLEKFLPDGIGLMLFGAFVVGVMVSLTTSLPGMVGIPQDTPAAILALAAAAIAFSMKAADPQALYPTVAAAIMLTSIVTGISFLLLGWFKASALIRYIPYPVIGGFLAGTGWLIAKGALGVMTNMPITLANLSAYARPDKLILWLPGLVFALALLLTLRKYSNILITPGALVLAAGVFYGYLWLAHIPIAQASAHGWLLGPFPSGGLYHPLAFSSFALIDWQVILQNLDKLAVVLILSVISLLLNASALEVAVRQDIDLDRELLTAGVANLAGGLGGSPVGYQALSLTALSHRLGAKSRLVNLISGLLCGATLFFGAALIGYFPRMVFGGMLLYLGLTFMVEWLIDARRLLPLADYLLVWVIVGVIAAFGFLEGIGAGILIAVILFVISYSRVNAIKNILDGGIYHSNVDRPKNHRDLLNQKGSQIHILRLQGFLFFGTIQKILEEVRSRMHQKEPQPLNYLILDFQRVERLDSSAVFGITRLKQLARAGNLTMAWSDLSPSIKKQLERGGLLDPQDETFMMMPSLDHAMEWCENKLLAAQGITDLTGVYEIGRGLFKQTFPELQSTDRLLNYLERKLVKQGDFLMHKGDSPDEMFFILSGLFTIQLEHPGGRIMRLRSVRGGATVGEVGLYLGTARTADVVVAQSGEVYRLSAQALKEMREKEPELAAHLHEWIAHLLAERLSTSDRTIEALMD